MGEKLTLKPLVVMPPILLAVLAVFLSLAWLIPNHTLPWPTFYSDAIAGVVLLFVALWVLVRAPGKLELIGLGLFFLVLAAIPWLQYLFGIIYSFGTAWINSLYLLGLALAIFAGWHWEKLKPGQCLDFLFLAISFASIISVAIQILQWLQMMTDTPWIISAGRSRFYANIGQPNQLASLLLLAVVGVVWGYAKKALGPVVGIVLVLYLLLGVALTESRTAWLNVAGILAALYFFWGESRPKHFRLVLLGIGAYLIALYFSLPVINDLFFGEKTIGREAGDPIRLEMWKNLAKAAMERPWLGYGWGQTTAAVLASRDFSGIAGMTRNAHNIVLDLLLYNGLLLGGLVLLVLGMTCRQFSTHLKHQYFIIPFLAVALLLVHAMLELPLHYAYFLLPFGMILGVLGRQSGLKVWVTCPKSIALGFWFAVTCGLWITVVDYLEAERTYFNVYFGKEGKAIPSEAQPKLMVLTQWKDRLIFANSLPVGGLSPEKLVWMKGVVVTTPNPALLFKLAQNLALNGRPDEAKEWLENMCKTTSSLLISGLASEWKNAYESNVTYQMVDWKGCRQSKVSVSNDLILKKDAC